MDQDLLDTLKALSDASRLRIVGLLAARPYTVEELAAALGLSPATAVHHLKRLRDAGLVVAREARPYVEYSLAVDRLHELGRRLGALDRETEEARTLPGPDGSPLPSYDAKVLRAFLAGDRLTAIPAQARKRDVILRWLLERCFSEDREYPEREVNARIAEVHEDTAALRRYLIETGLMTRSGGVYRRVRTTAAA